MFQTKSKENNMPRPRLTIEQAELSGSSAKDPKRFATRKKSPKTQGPIGTAPTYFNAALKKVWDEVSSSIPAGVAGGSDRLVIEMASRLMHQFRTDPEMSSAKVAILMNLLSRLGLDPQSRTKLQVDGAEEKNNQADEWSGIIN
jgi:phage terminase small subunit